jgi:hypothetical protein
MNTEAERNVPAHFPIDEEFVGSLKCFRVIVRCGKGNEQLVAFVYRAPLDDRIANNATTHGDRRVEAQHLFAHGEPDRVVERRAVEPGKIGWIRPEMPARIKRSR